MNKAEYIDEVQLIQNQNNTEFEIYPLVSKIIAPTLKGLAKRYVFARRISQLGQIYYGISSFPDIAIIDRNFNNKEHKAITPENWKKLKGCVEAKAYNERLCGLEELKDQIEKAREEARKLKDKKDPKELKDLFSKYRPTVQLIGEILWYKKVLYTNGVQWKFFSLTYLEGEEDHIIEIVKERIDDKHLIWWNDDKIKDIINRISEETIIEDCRTNWDEFISKIGRIDWKA